MDLQHEKETTPQHISADEKNEIVAEEVTSELSAPNWSVVSFERLIAGNLTYAEAVEKLKQLAAEKVSGLCIITDEAAERIKNQSPRAAELPKN